MRDCLFQLVELEGIKGVAHSKDLMDRMTAEAGDTFDEFLDSSQTDDEECKSEEKAVGKLINK